MFTLGRLALPALARLRPLPLHRKGGLKPLPGAGRRRFAGFRTRGLAALALCGLCGLARAGEPAGPTEPSKGAGTSTTNEVGLATRTAPVAVPTPPPVPPDELWYNLVGRYQAYVHTKGGEPPWLAPDPHEGCAVHFFVEGGFYMVQSYFGHNHAFFVNQRQGTGAGATTTTARRDFDYGLNFIPRVTLGAAGDGGLGFRASWFRLEETEQAPPFSGGNATLNTTFRSVPIPGFPGITSPGTVAQQLKIFADRLAFDNSVQLQVWDWEVFQGFARADWSLLVAGGLRYGYLSQGYRGFRSNSGTAKSGTTTITLREDSDLLSTGRNFSGVGPTAAFEAFRRLGCSGFSLYGTARGSLLFGRAHQRTFQRTALNQQTQVGTAAPKTTATATLRQADSGGAEAIPVGDLEVGVDWRIHYGRALVFTQVGFVNETWFGTGNATSGGGDFGFFGLRVSLGVSY
jgi:hypothetical protein